LLVDALKQGPAIARYRQLCHDLMVQCHGKDVLELGSEAWKSWIDFQSSPPKSLTAINISETELFKGIKTAKNLKVENNIDFLLMDAHSLDFPDNSFDFVYGASILHHLDIKKAILEIHRVLKPNATILFLEPLIYNPIAIIFRLFTPNARTQDEKPFGLKELGIIDQFFVTKHYYFQFIEPFFTVTSAFLMKNPQNILTKSGDSLDQLIERLPLIKYLYRFLLISGIKRYN
jgi:ubiquinone/menaquinone biosynthesis C-methylase UbiE